MKIVKRVGCILLASLFALCRFLVTMIAFMLIADAILDTMVIWTPSYAKTAHTATRATARWSQEHS